MKYYERLGCGAVALQKLLSTKLSSHLEMKLSWDPLVDVIN